jgi:hypothetical protein
MAAPASERIRIRIEMRSVQAWVGGRAPGGGKWGFKGGVREDRKFERV